MTHLNITIDSAQLSQFRRFVVQWLLICAWCTAVVAIATSALLYFFAVPVFIGSQQSFGGTPPSLLVDLGTRAALLSIFPLVALAVAVYFTVIPRSRVTVISVIGSAVALSLLGVATVGVPALMFASTMVELGSGV